MNAKENRRSQEKKAVKSAAELDSRLEADARSGHEVEFRGPILLREPATSNLIVPAKFLGHPLIQGQCFFTLPRALWDEVLNQVGHEKFDSELVKVEDTLAEICGDHSTHVGFLDGKGICFELRRPAAWTPSEEFARSIGWQVNQAKLDLIIRLLGLPSLINVQRSQ
jgi:hypothetical protein